MENQTYTTIEGNKVPGQAKRITNNSMPRRFGGFDVGIRKDHSAFAIINIEGTKIDVEFLHEWETKENNPDIDYIDVARDVYKIQAKLPMIGIGFDRGGVGDGIRVLFDPNLIPLYEINLTNTIKIQIINNMKLLLSRKLLFFRGGPVAQKLIQQIEEQEVTKTAAGNLRYLHPSNSHDDLFWALGLAIFAAMERFGEYDIPLIIQRGYPGSKENITISESDDKLLKKWNLM